MQDSKMIKMLSTLSKEEFKYLGWFVRSDFFNTDQNLIKLYGILKKHYPDFTAKGMEKRKIFNQLFPGTSYSDGKMRNLISKMYRLLAEYMLVIELRENKLKRNMLLAEAFKKRGLLNELRTTTKSIIEKLNKSPYRDEVYFHSVKTLYQNTYFYSENINKTEANETLELVRNNLDRYYELAKLRIDGELEARRALFESPLYKNIEKNEDEKLKTNTIYQIMENILELYKTSQDSIYLNTKNLFFENYKTIRKIEQKFILKHLLGHAIRQIPKKEVKFLKEVTHLYMFAHTQDLLTTNGKITNTSFLNIVLTTARTKEFKWAEQFILDNEQKLEQKTREEIKILGLANLAFHQKDFPAVLRLMAPTKFHNVHYEILAKILSLKSYFEIFITDESYFDLILSYANSFEKFLKRNIQKIGKNKSLSIINFIKLIRKLTYFKYKKNYTSKDWCKLKLETEYPTIIERSWLLSKMEGSILGKQ